MNFLLWILFGGLTGWIASLLMGTDAEMGLFANIIVGIIGAFLGGWIAGKAGAKKGMDMAEGEGSVILRLVWAVIGAVILLAVIGLIT